MDFLQNLEEIISVAATWKGSDEDLQEHIYERFGIHVQVQWDDDKEMYRIPMTIEDFIEMLQDHISKEEQGVQDKA
jgi:hypothetical protein